MSFDVWKQAKLMNGFDALKSASLPDNSIDSIDDMKRLAGITTNNTISHNIGMTGTERAQAMRENNIKPGTPEWFKLWFSKPQLTGEKPIGE